MKRSMRRRFVGFLNGPNYGTAAKHGLLSWRGGLFYGDCSDAYQHHWILGGDLLSGPRRFPSPWFVEKLDACFVVRDHNGKQLAYI